MPVEKELAAVSPERDMLLTIGVFDGVHLGHKDLLSQLTGRARQQNLLSGVITFRQHPQQVLSPRIKISFLTSLTERTRLLKNEGVDAVIILPFTRELAGISARNGRLISSTRLLSEAGQALKQAESSGGGSIVAFRADPDKYRAAIAARSAGRRR